MSADPDARLLEGVPFHVYPVLSSTSRSRAVMLSGAFGVLALTSVPFAISGAWPVAVAATVTGGMLTGAFSLCARKNRQHQILLLKGAELHVDTVSPSQAATRITLHAGWTRARMAPEDRAGQPHGPESLLEVTERLCLTDGKRRAYIGDFLPPSERPLLKSVIERSLQLHAVK